jgi:hypothetical protein
MNAGDSITIDSAFSFYVKEDVKDQHDVLFEFLVSDGSNSWTSFHTQILNAPELLSSVLSINDLTGNANGVAEAGELFLVNIKYVNSGHSYADSVFAVVVSANPDISFLSDSVMFSLDEQSDTIISFQAQLSALTPLNAEIDVFSSVYAGSHVYDSLYIIIAGYLFEDFETGDLSQYDWQLSGAMPWFVSSFLPYEGSFCLQSGDINDNESTILRITIDVTRKDSLTFMYKTDSESVWDNLQLMIDSINRFTSSGTFDWQYSSALMDTGIHIVEFIYSKDNVFSAGMDCAWLDDIRFPPFTTVVAIEELSLTEEIYIFPNPAISSLNIRMQEGMQADRLAIYNMNGQLVHQEKMHLKDQNRIFVDDWQEGIYLIVVFNGDSVYRKLFVVKH